MDGRSFATNPIDWYSAASKDFVGRMRLRYAHASIRGESLDVHGRIIVESGAAPFEQDGILLVVIESPDKRELGRASAEYHLSAKLPRGGGGFSVELPLVPPKGSVMKISWKQVPQNQRTEE